MLREPKQELSNPARLVSRYLDLIPGARLVVAGSYDPSLCRLLPPSMQVVTLDYAHYESAERHWPAAFGPGEVDADACLIVEPDGNTIAEMLLAWAGRCRWVGLVSENRRGGRTFGRLFQEPLLQAGAHCCLWTGHPSGRRCFSLDNWYSTFCVEAAGRRLRVSDLPGVFSRGHLDSGTKLLIESLELPNKGRVLELGCGSGIVGTWMKLSGPELKVDMADKSWLAVASAKSTAMANEACVRVYGSDAYSQVSGLFDLIVCNPSFHSGNAMEFSTIGRFIEGAADHLSRNGSFVMVGNKGLGHRRRMESAFRRVELLAESDHYEVWSGG